MKKINWLQSFLDLAEKKTGKTIVREKRTIKGITAIDGKYFILDYLPLSGFIWYNALEITPNEYEMYSSKKSLPPDLSYSVDGFFYNAEDETFVNFEKLPSKIKKNIKSLQSI